MNRGRTLRLVAAAGAAALALATVAVAEEAVASLALGSPAPRADIKMKATDGRDVSISDVAGPKGTLVVFTCNHCPWAKAWEQRIVQIGNDWSARGFGVIAINPNDPTALPEDSFDEMQKHARERGMRFPYAVDSTSDVARAFGATHTPEAYLFDAGGKLVYKGAVDDNAKAPDEVKAHYLADALEALVSGKEPVIRESKALGCSIKYRKAT